MATKPIGALRVDLGMNSAKFNKGMDKAQRRMKRFGGAIDKIAKGAGLALAGVSVAVTASLRKTIVEADKLTKTAKGMGVATEFLSEIAHGADLAGLEFEQFTKSLAKFQKSLGDSIRTSTSEQAMAFKFLEINVSDAEGRLRSIEDILPEVADKFAEMEDGTDKSALAMSLFGARMGQKMIPFLNEGRAGLEKFRKEARALGLTLDQDTGKKAENFNDNLTRLGKVWDGLILRLTAKLLPSLESFSEWMLEGAKSGARFAETFELIKKAADFTAESIIKFNGFVRQLGVEWQVYSDVVSKALDGDFSGASARYKKGLEEINSAIKQTQNEVANFSLDKHNKQFKPLSLFGDMEDQDFQQAIDKFNSFGKNAQKTYSDVGKGFADFLKNFRNKSKEETDKTAETFKSLKESLVSSISSVDVYTRSIGLTAGQAERLAAATEIHNTLQAQGITLTDAQTASLDQLLNRLQETVEKQEFVEEATTRTADAFGAMFDNVLENGKFKMSALLDIVQSTLKDMASAAFKSGITRVLGNVFGGGPTNILPAGLFGNAKGNAFNQGNIVPFASGGVVNAPTLFPMNDNKTGLMGEAGPEAIMPLKRAANGDLGVQASGMGGTHIENHFHIDARGAVEGTAEQIRKAIAAETPRIVNQSVRAVRQKNKNNGGKYV